MLSNVPARRLLRSTPATTLAEMPKTLHPEALETAEELKAFYRFEIQKVRGVDRTSRLRICLEDAYASELNFKGFLVGHPGVGKTTELSRLLLQLDKQFLPVRLSITSELNPGVIRFYDVLLLMLIRLVREVTQPSVIGFKDTDLETMIGWVRDHLATKWTTQLRTTAADFGAGVSFPFPKLFGNIKLGTKREHGVEEYELSLVSDLVDLMNRVFRECNRLLKKHQDGRQFVIVLEDFEKTGLNATELKNLFTGLRPSLQGLDGHFIVVIPAWLQYSVDAGIVLPPNFNSFAIPDIAVYQKDHREDHHVIDALKAVVSARANERLFADSVLERLCIASGGNLRDLFELIRSGMLSARVRFADAISVEDARVAVAELRDKYKQRLGSTGEESTETPLTAKLDRLVGVYEGEDRTEEVPDPVLYLLLKQRCALEYNGERWIGVHPLIVDLLIEFKRLEKGSPGGSGL